MSAINTLSRHFVRSTPASILGLALGTLFASASSFAAAPCTDLSGSYQGNIHGSTYTITLEQKGCESLTTKTCLSGTTQCQTNDYLGNGQARTVTTAGFTTVAIAAFAGSRVVLSQLTTSAGDPNYVYQITEVLEKTGPVSATSEGNVLSKTVYAGSLASPATLKPQVSTFAAVN